MTYICSAMLSLFQLGIGFHFLYIFFSWGGGGGGGGGGSCGGIIIPLSKWIFIFTSLVG